MSKEEVITATEASRSFSDVLHRVCYSGESFIIKKGNRMMARIVPVDESEVAVAKSVKVKEPAKSDSPPAPKAAPQKNEARDVAPVEKAPPAPAAKSPEVAAEASPYSDPNYYKTVLAEMNKMLSE